MPAKAAAYAFFYRAAAWRLTAARCEAASVAHFRALPLTMAGFDGARRAAARPAPVFVIRPLCKASACPVHFPPNKGAMPERLGRGGARKPCQGDAGPDKTMGGKVIERPIEPSRRSLSNAVACAPAFAPAFASAFASAPGPGPGPAPAGA